MTVEPANATSTEEVKAEDARKAWAALLNGAQWQGQNTTITRSGKRAAVLVSPEWYDQAVALMAESPGARPTT